MIATKKINATNAYRNFIRQHPNSTFVDSAKYKLQELSWSEVIQINTIEAYERYLENFEGIPPNLHMEEARSRLDPINYWPIAKRENTLSSYRKYISLLEKSNSSENLSEALSKVEFLEQEILKGTKKAAWEAFRYPHEVSTFMLNEIDLVIQVELSSSSQTQGPYSTKDELREYIKSQLAATIRQIAKINDIPKEWSILVEILHPIICAEQYCFSTENIRVYHLSH